MAPVIGRLRAGLGDVSEVTTWAWGGVVDEKLGGVAFGGRGEGGETWVGGVMGLVYVGAWTDTGIGHCVQLSLSPADKCHLE